MTDQRFAELQNEIKRQKNLPNLHKAESKCKYVRKHGCSILAVDDCRKLGKCKWFKKGEATI